MMNSRSFKAAGGTRRLFAALLLLCVSHPAQAALQSRANDQEGAHRNHDALLQEKLKRGWNSWNTNDVASQVLLPAGLEIRIGLARQDLAMAIPLLSGLVTGTGVGSLGQEVVPGLHALDGSYTDLTIKWSGYSVRVQTAHDGRDLVMLVTPGERPAGTDIPIAAVFSAGMLWNRAGSVRRVGTGINATIGGNVMPIHVVGHVTDELNIPIVGSYVNTILDVSAAISTGRARSKEEIGRIIGRERLKLETSYNAADASGEVQAAMRDVLAWNMIYEPERDRIVVPVGRNWNATRGGYVLFAWDSFLTARAAAHVDRDLAYSMILEALSETTPGGFVPQYSKARRRKTYDRSNPPVGSATVLSLFREFGDAWILRDTYDRLMSWNRWWPTAREVDGFLTWGSDSQNAPGNILADKSTGTKAGAVLESGLDNSPIYDDAVYDPATHRLRYADVGLTSLYIADCKALAEIADVLGKAADATELRKRAAAYSARLQTLWSDEKGIFLSRDLVTGRPVERLSPTNFYPLFAGVATARQAERMAQRYLLKPDKFGGPWPLPSISRDDPAFKDQNYWRGRVWPPMNYLIYLGLKRYQSRGVADSRTHLASESLAMLLREWRLKRHVHENYSATSEDSDSTSNSDTLYTWGILLAAIALDESKPDPSAAIASP